MAIKGKFNVDTRALKQRIKAHDRYGSYDLNEWIFGFLNLTSGLTVLELGCGTGRQTLPVADKLGKSGKIVAVDVSESALDELLESSRACGLADRIAPVQCELDEFESCERAFDRVLCVYALYYAKCSSRIFDVVYQALKLDGQFFYCGPSETNNAELKQFHGCLQGATATAITEASMFMEQVGLSLARERFSEIQVFRFENPLSFRSEEGLYNYWRSYNLYDQRLEAAFKNKAAAHFRRYQVFETVKRVVGVRAVK